LLGLTLREYECTLLLNIVNTWSCGVGRLVQLNRLIIYSDNSIRSVLSNNNNFGNFIRGNSFDGLGLLEADLTWLIIVDDCNSSPGVLSLKLLHGIWVVKLDVEVLIWLPVVVISDLNCDELDMVSILELQGLLDLFVVVSGFSLGVDGAYSDGASDSLFINNVNLEGSGSLGH